MGGAAGFALGDGIHMSLQHCCAPTARGPMTCLYYNDYRRSLFMIFSSYVLRRPLLLAVLSLTVFALQTRRNLCFCSRISTRCSRHSYSELGVCVDYDFLTFSDVL